MMRWLVLLVGLLITCVGSAGAAALVTTARDAVAEAVSRRLRGGVESLAWLAGTQREVVAATAATSFGVAMVGAAIPGVFQEASPLELALLVCFLVVPATLIGGYLLPRWHTMPRAEKIVDQLGPVLKGWSAALSIVLPSRSGDAASDLRALAREGSASGVNDDELVMVGGVMTFTERPVRAVMTPRTEVVAVEHGATYDQVAAVIAESGYTRIPVFRESLDEIVGMVHAFDLFKHQPGEPLPLRPVTFSPELRAAGDLLLDMQRERQHFAVVVDEFGGTAGIVTLDDLLTALVGQIADEDVGPAAAVTVGADVLELDGSATPANVAEHFGVVLPRSDAASFGGLIAELAGRIPRTGEQFTLATLEIEVLHASPTRIERLLVRRGPSNRIPLGPAT